MSQGITTISITTLSIMTLSVMTISKLDLFATLSLIDDEHNAMPNVAFKLLN